MSELVDESEGLRQHEINIKADKTGENDIDHIPADQIRLSILSTSYTKKELERLLNVLPVGDVKMRDLTRWARVWKSRSDNVNFIHGPQSKNHLNHASGLIKLSLTLLRSGYSVHLVESVNSSDVRILKDVDLVVSLDGVLTAIDYTNSIFLGYDTGVLVEHYGEDYCYYSSGNQPFLTGKLEKLKHLVDVCDDHHICRHMDLVEENIKIDIKHRYSSDRSDSIRKAGEYVECSMELKVKDVKKTFGYFSQAS
jgi:hypothetical protein